MDTIPLVKIFMEAAGQGFYPAKTVPPLDVLKLRLSIELEELYEKAQAMGLEQTFCWMLSDKSQVDIGRESYGLDSSIKDTGVYDPVALLDACCDQRYVQDGTVLTCGLDTVFYDAFAEVQRSNLSKFPATTSEANATISSYINKGISTSLSGEAPYVVRRIPDGKILKSINYSPANLAPFVERR